MDFSRLHTYTPPQCVPENTGYTYALSSSYSTAALDFEKEHNLDPVFDSPRMSRRSLRSSAAAYSTTKDASSEKVYAAGSSISYSGKKTLVDQSSKITKQHKSVAKQSVSVKYNTRKNAPSSSVFSHSSFSSHASDGSFMSTILDESSIQEQTAVDHFWGLDDDGDLKGGDATVIQANGDITATENQSVLSNGYTCNDCSMLSERKEVLTAYSAPRLPSSRIYSRDRSQKHKSTHSNYCGSMNVKEFLREDGHLGMNGESLCDDCKGKKHLETHTTAHMQSSRSKRVARTIWHIFSYAGFFLLHVLQRMGTAGWFVSRKVVSLLWLAVVSPGKAAAGVFWWLGTGWYQLVTLISLLNVFLLTRCLPKIFRLLLFLLPLLLLLGLWHWGTEGFLSLFPALNWTSFHRTYRWEDAATVVESHPGSPYAVQHSEETMKFFDASRVRELEKQLALMSERWHHREEEYSKMLLLLQNMQDQVAQMNDKSETLILIKNIVGQHLKEMQPDQTAKDALALHQEHEWRIGALEDLLAKLSEKSEGIQKELELTKTKTASDMDEQNQHFSSKIKHLELELSHVKSELLNSQGLKTSCASVDMLQEKVDAQVTESVKFILFGHQKGDLPESLLQWLTSKFVSKSDLRVLLQDLESRILRNITLHMSVTNTKSASEVVTSVVNEAGIAGITEAQARLIVNNALKLFSQDKTGMVDFALESGGGSVLSTRCSETYETKTALISLFGIPLWYFSQSPSSRHPGIIKMRAIS
uniref:Sad1 and UNC84 domain containing 1 n=1 Tax=Anolis carolinensis TaxID=28377 RepID=A0A803TLT7_ANOCA